MTVLKWEAVRSSTGRGRPIVYWRLTDSRQFIASLARRTADGDTAYRAPDTAAWTAQLYAADARPGTYHVGRIPLGDFPNRAAAEAAVLQALRVEGRSITCPRCGRTSYNPNDIREGYCGHCHDWTQPKLTGTDEAP